MRVEGLGKPVLSRRDVLRRSGIGAGAFAAGSALGQYRPNRIRAASSLSVLAPLPPDPAPPGVAGYAEEEFAAWKADRDVRVTYDALRWPDLRDEIEAEFDADGSRLDVLYMSSWVPEFSPYLMPVGDILTPDVTSDLPSSWSNTMSWEGGIYGVPYTLSLLTLFYNQEHFEAAGLTRPPETWDELKGYAEALTRGDEQYGWVLNYGAPWGIGGVASYWMVFLLQAGGTMYDVDGYPVFDDQAGIEALQLMIDLMPYTAPISLTSAGIIDATAALKTEKASMMMNWPFMWKDALDPVMSTLPGKLGGAILPAGPAGSASIDGSDAWTIAALTDEPDLALDLIEFYLDPEVQKKQVLETGWLPVRLSVLGDPEVQQAATNAAVVLEQAQHPYDSFVTPDYDAVTQVLGVEIQQALAGAKTAAAAIRDASVEVEALVTRRLIGR